MNSMRTQEVFRALDLRVTRSAASRTRRQRLLRMPMAVLRSKTARIFSQLRRSPVRVRVKTFWGRSMTVVVPEPVSMNILEHGYVEEDLTRIMLAILTPGMVVFDIGAHFGYYSLLASWRVGEAGRVIAFEPTPASREILYLNTGAARNVSIEPVAAWSSAGQRAFHDFGFELSAFNSFFQPRLSEYLPQHVEILVDTVTVDGYAEASGIRPDVVKIDAESSEMDILRGMGSTLRSIRPAVTLEAGDIGVDGASSTMECISYLRSVGYLPFEFSDGAIRPHRSLPFYAHGNLLFVHEGRIPEFFPASK